MVIYRRERGVLGISRNASSGPAGDRGERGKGHRKENNREVEGRTCGLKNSNASSNVTFCRKCFHSKKKKKVSSSLAQAERREEKACCSCNPAWGGWILSAGAGEQEAAPAPCGCPQGVGQEGRCGRALGICLASGLVESGAVPVSEEGLGTWAFQRSNQLWGAQNHGPSPPEMLRNSTQIILSL